MLTQPIQSRYVHRGDDIYAQTTSPVHSGNEMVIPPGTFVQGTVEKLERKSGRGKLHLQSMSLTFPDGYVIPIAGPLTLTTTDGYAFPDLGPRRSVGMFTLPLAGAGLGALIGHSAGKTDSQTTSSFPPGCIGGSPFCTSTTTPVFGTKTKDAIIGAGIGGAIGGLASLTLLFSTRSFFLDVGSPVEMVLQQPISLPEDQVAEAIRDALKEPVSVQVVAPLPRPALPTPDNDSGSPPAPTGGAPIVIPGAPGPDGAPGPPIIIPPPNP